MPDVVRQLLEQIIAFRVSDPTNPDALYLQNLAAKALLIYNDNSDNSSPMSVRTAGRAGGEARKQKLTSEQRSEIAQKAALSRWSKGGIARNAALSADRRREIAQHSAEARWRTKPK